MSNDSCPLFNVTFGLVGANVLKCRAIITFHRPLLVNLTNLVEEPVSTLVIVRLPAFINCRITTNTTTVSTEMLKSRRSCVCSTLLFEIINIRP